MLSTAFGRDNHVGIYLYSPYMVVHIHVHVVKMYASFHKIVLYNLIILIRKNGLTSTIACSQFQRKKRQGGKRGEREGERGRRSEREREREREMMDAGR